MTKRTAEAGAPPKQRVKPIPDELPEDCVLSIAGVEICRAGEELTPEEIDRRYSLAEERIFGMLPRAYEELCIDPPDHSLPATEEDELETEPSPESDAK